MRINFRQGIVSAQTNFLQKTGIADVTINADTRPVTVSVAHLSNNYTHSEDATVPAAWPNAAPVSATYTYLYWDFNPLTFIPSYGTTEIQPISQATPPTTGTDMFGDPLFIEGRHWYDTANHIHYVLTSGVWVAVLRVFAAGFDGTNFLSLSDTGAFTGTQIGDNSTNNGSGRVLFAEAGFPMRRDDGTFFTTEDQFFINQSRVDSVRLESNVTRAQSNANLGAFSAVAWIDDGRIASATYNHTGSTVVGLLTESLGNGEVGAVVVQGMVTNPNWSWTTGAGAVTVGSELWIKSGELVTIDPNVSAPSIYPTKQVPVARVLSIDTVIFEQGLGGVGPQGPIGTVDELPVAEAGQLGVVSLSAIPLNALDPVVVTTSDALYIGAPYAPESHFHDAVTITVSPLITNIDSNNVQGALSLVLPLEGGTMTGSTPLILNSAPVAAAQQAATKAYVDSIATGLTSKEACMVGTIGNLGGSYAPTGGTGGTGAFTGAVLSALDGVYGVDYELTNGSRILVKDQTDAKQNGIYIVTTLVIGSPPPASIDLERAPDFDSNDEIRAGAYTLLRSGLTLEGTGWVLTDVHAIDDILLNVHDITWALFSSPAAYAGSSTIDIAATLPYVISVIPKTVDALSWNGETVTLVGSPPADGQILTYNAGTWENTDANTDALTWNGESLTLIGSPPTDGQILTYNAGTWENIDPVSALCDLVVTCDAGSTTIETPKDLFALNINSNTGVSINNSTAVGTPDSGYDFAGVSGLTSDLKTPDNTDTTFGHVINDGTRMQWNDAAAVTNKTVHIRDLSIPYDITSGTNDLEVTYTSGSASGGQGIFEFSPDGLRMFAMYIPGDSIWQYDLSVAYDISTAAAGVESAALPLPVAITNPPKFSEDGLHVYVTYDPTDPGISEWTLGTAWDITTLIPANVTSLFLDPGLPKHITYHTFWSLANSDGTKFFTVTRNDDFTAIYINQYDMSVAHDVSTGIRNVGVGEISLPVLAQPSTTIRGIDSSPDGTHFYVFTDDEIIHYDISLGDGVVGATTTTTTLYHNNAESLTTTVAGVEVTGVLTFAAEGSPSNTPQVVFPNYTTVGIPATTLEGGTIYDTDVNKLKVYDGTTWATVGSDPAMGDLTDVVVTGSPAAVSGEVLKFDGVNWVNTASSLVEPYVEINSTGTLPVATGTDSIVIGEGSSAGLDNQVVIGSEITAADGVGSIDIAHDLKIGSGNITDKNLIHLHTKGKLELVGDEAQFVLPNYTTAQIIAPLAGVEGGTVWNSDTKELTVYDGATWSQPTASKKPLFEKIVIPVGSPVSNIIPTTIPTVAAAGSPLLVATLQVFRNGLLQEEDIDGGSPLEGDFYVSGATEITFTEASLFEGGSIIIYSFLD